MNITFWCDEKKSWKFELTEIYHYRNCCVNAPSEKTEKFQIHDFILIEWDLKPVKVSIGVSKFAKRQLLLLRKVQKLIQSIIVRIKCSVLASLIPEMDNSTDNNVFMKDGPRFHTRKSTFKYLNNHVSEFIKPDSCPPKYSWLEPYGLLYMVTTREHGLCYCSAKTAGNWFLKRDSPWKD